MTTAQIGAEGWDGVPGPDDRWHLSASSLSDALAAPALERWGERVTAEKVVENLSLLQHLAATSPDAAREFVRSAKYGPKTPGELGAADRGTAIHAYLEARFKGTPTPVLPPQHAEQIAPYLVHLERWLVEFMPEPVEIEVAVLNPADGNGGRLDFKLKFPRPIKGYPAAQPVLIVDGKTKDKGYTPRGNPTKPYGDSHPLQQAIYVNATHLCTWQPRVMPGAGGGRFYLANDDELALATVPHPVDGAALLWITPDHCTLYPVDVGPHVYAYARCVADAWRWLHLVSKSTIGEPVTALEAAP